MHTLSRNIDCQLWHRLSLTLHYRLEQIQLCESRNGLKSCFQTNLDTVQNNMRVISLFDNIVENTLSLCIYSTSTYWFITDGISCLWTTSCSPLVRFFDTFNRSRYISVVLKPVILPFIWAMQSAFFQYDNVWQHVITVFWASLDAENV